MLQSWISIARQSGWERRVNQDETRQPSEAIVDAGRRFGKRFD
jgi:hypothetical protein